MTAVAPPEGLTRMQTLCFRSLSDAMTGHPLDLAAVTPISAEDYARGLARRDRAFRIRMVQMMIVLALLLRRVPPEVAARLQAFADELSVGEDCRDLLNATRHLAAGALGLAMADFERNGYETMAQERSGDGAEHTAAEYWAEAPDDPELAARWQGLEQCAEGTLGRRMWEFYRARGFAFPGTPGSAPPALAQHDWIHVLGDYGTTVESELEVFGLIARASDDPRAFTLLIQVLGLFESGYLQAGMGLFQMDVGHLSADEEAMALRASPTPSAGGPERHGPTTTPTARTPASTSWPRTGSPTPTRPSTRSGPPSSSTVRRPSPTRRWPSGRSGRGRRVASPRTRPRRGGTGPRPKVDRTTPTGRHRLPRLRRCRLRSGCSTAASVA